MLDESNAMKALKAKANSGRSFLTGAMRCRERKPEIWHEGNEGTLVFALMPHNNTIFRPRPAFHHHPQILPGASLAGAGLT